MRARVYSPRFSYSRTERPSVDWSSAVSMRPTGPAPTTCTRVQSTEAESTGWPNGRRGDGFGSLPPVMRIGVVGAGIIGLAVARRLAELRPDATVTVLEKEADIATHQTGRNSGVVHAGIYYAPGSLKARLCRLGVAQLHAYCTEKRIPYEECGKLVVAVDESELGRLRELERRAIENGVPGMRWLEGDELRDIEPHAAGVAGRPSPTTAITDYRAVARAALSGAGPGLPVPRCPFHAPGLGRRRCRPERRAGARAGGLPPARRPLRRPGGDAPLAGVPPPCTETLANGRPRAARIALAAGVRGRGAPLRPDAPDRGSRASAGRDPRAGGRLGRVARRRLQDPASRSGHGRPQRAVAGSDVEHGDRRPHRRRGATGRLKLRAWAPAARFLADAGGNGHRMPIGYLITVAVVALGMLLALRPVHRPPPLRTASWALGSIVNESPFVAFYWVLAATLLALAQGDLETPVGWVGLGIACVTLLATPVLVRRSLAARPILEDGLGPEWRGGIDPTLASRFRRSLPWVRILLAPVPVLHRGVKRARNLSYGDAGRRNRLDVYHHPAA